MNLNYPLLMKKLLISIMLSFTLLFSSSAMALDPKLKILGTMSTYGVVGGALLGAATMAFGSSGRAIAKGASLGLYGGLIFGTYVILSYEMKKRGFNDQPREDYYPDSSSPYEDRSSVTVIEEYRLAGAENKKDPRKDPLISFNFINYQF